jgi:hypothetical protein
VFWRKAKRSGELDAGADALGRLLEREQRIASLCDAAREDANRVLAEAREYASRTEAACESLINERIVQLSSAYEAQLEADLQRIESEAAEETGRFADVDPARMRALVALVLEKIGAVSAQNAGAPG